MTWGTQPSRRLGVELKAAAERGRRGEEARAVGPSRVGIKQRDIIGGRGGAVAIGRAGLDEMGEGKEGSRWTSGSSDDCLSNASLNRHQTMSPPHLPIYLAQISPLSPVPNQQPSDSPLLFPTIQLNLASIRVHLTEAAAKLPDGGVVVFPEYGAQGILQGFPVREASPLQHQVFGSSEKLIRFVLPSDLSVPCPSCPLPAQSIKGAVEKAGTCYRHHVGGAVGRAAARSSPISFRTRREDDTPSSPSRRFRAAEMVRGNAKGQRDRYRDGQCGVLYRRCKYALSFSLLPFSDR
jgi:hypothetical protein